MDVQAATATLAPTATPSTGAPSGAPTRAAFVLPSIAGTTSATAPAPAPAATSASIGPPPDPNPGLALLPSGSANGGSGRPSSGQSLSGNVAALYNAPKDSTEVSYRVAPGSNEIVTVVSDKATGKVIVQFPSETLIALAQFFQKLDGSVVDQKV